MLNLPNTLTLVRILLLPVFIWLFFMEPKWGQQTAWLLLQFYFLAAVTDFLDGYLARKYNKVTPLGTFLDPISDKIFVATLLIDLAYSVTSVQMIALGVLIIGPYYPYGLLGGQILLYLAALITLITGWGYLKTGLDHMKNKA